MPRGPLPAFRIGNHSLRRAARDFAAPNPSAPTSDCARARSNPGWPVSSRSFGPPGWRAPPPRRTCSAGGDPDQNLMSVLGMDASSMNFQGRAVLGNVFLWNFLNFLGVPASFQGQWWQDLALPALEPFNNFGYFRLESASCSTSDSRESSFPVDFSTVADGPLSETDPLPRGRRPSAAASKGTTSTWLQTASVADIQSENYPGPKPTSLLYKILRQSLLLEYANLAGQRGSARGQSDGRADSTRPRSVAVAARTPPTLTPLAASRAPVESRTRIDLGGISARAQLRGRLAFAALERFPRQPSPTWHRFPPPSSTAC